MYKECDLITNYIHNYTNQILKGEIIKKVIYNQLKELKSLRLSLNNGSHGSWKNITIGYYDSSTIRYELS